MVDLEGDPVGDLIPPFTDKGITEVYCNTNGEETKVGRNEST